jgi:hypothetical protein
VEFVILDRSLRGIIERQPRIELVAVNRTLTITKQSLCINLVFAAA